LKAGLARFRINQENQPTIPGTIGLGRIELPCKQNGKHTSSKVKSQFEPIAATDKTHGVNKIEGLPDWVSWLQ